MDPLKVVKPAVSAAPSGTIPAEAGFDERLVKGDLRGLHFSFAKFRGTVSPENRFDAALPQIVQARDRVRSVLPSLEDPGPPIDIGAARLSPQLVEDYFVQAGREIVQTHLRAIACDDVEYHHGVRSTQRFFVLANNVFHDNFHPRFVRLKKVLMEKVASLEGGASDTVIDDLPVQINRARTTDNCEFRFSLPSGGAVEITWYATHNFLKNPADGTDISPRDHYAHFTVDGIEVTASRMRQEDLHYSSKALRERSHHKGMIYTYNLNDGGPPIVVLGGNGQVNLSDITLEA